MTDGGTLTAQEIDASRQARFDVGPGYPQLSLPQWCREIIASRLITDTMLSMPPVWRPSDSVATDERLERSVRKLLKVPPTAQVVRPTFSGSVALERAMTAIVRLARERGCARVRVITTSPSIDIMKWFLSEHVEIVPEFVTTIGVPDLTLSLDRAGYLSRLSAAIDGHPGDLHLALLTSPENPTGETWSCSELSAIAALCARANGVLLLDHCFLLAGVHERRPVAVWDIATPELEWIGIWDTGKTLGLNEEKLGFLIAGGGRLPAKVIEAVNTVQFDVSRRQKLTFTEVLSHEGFDEYLAKLRTVCARNSRRLQDDLAADRRFRVRIPTAGTFAIVDCEGLGHDDLGLHRQLLAQGVGVIAGRVFFHVDPVPKSLIRIALAREPEYFATALARLRDVVTVKGSSGS